MPRKLPPLHELTAFDAAARHGSFTRAAEELCLTLSAISHRVRRLEETLQTQLFDRARPGVTLTRAGAHFAHAVRDILNRLHLAHTTMTPSPPPGLPAGVPILRLFRARARRGSKAALAGKLRTNSAALVQNHPAFLGLICGGPAGSDDRDFVFATLWRDFDGLKSLFGPRWSEALLPDGYAEIIETWSVEHFTVLALPVPQDQTTRIP